MGKFKKKPAKKPEIPTSALPDIIFILLFFFMVTTKMRKADPKVDIQLPDVTQIQDLDETKEALDIYIGKPKDRSRFGDEPIIQVKEKFIAPNEIHQIIAETLAGMPVTRRSKNNIVVHIRVDEETTMGLVTDLKEELRKSSVLNVHYTSNKLKGEKS